ncbi:hypothetical protein LTR66_006425 [Elasticomyces elasticus]|nr:hypothetical protein LTR66_006425 [Elasticomyces elasticus]
MASYAAITAYTSEHGSRPASAASVSRQRSQRHKKESGTIGSASWLSSVINLLNTIVGAGVLAMPSALSHMGILLGTFVILWAGLTAGFGLYLQTRCARYLERGSASFFALSQITYPNAAVMFDAAIAIKCFGVGISYLIIIGDLMPGVVKGFNGEVEGFLVQRRFWITAFMLIVIPFSFLRRLDSLKYTSVVALISIGYLVILVVYHFAAGDTMSERGDIRFIEWAGAASTLSSFPVIVFAYTCHQNMFSILNEIKDNSPLRTTSVVTASIGSAGAIYVLVAITGYLSFGNNVAGNIVAQFHPCRASVDAVLKWRPSRLRSSSTSPSSSPSRSSLLVKRNASRPARDEMGETRFAAITTVIVVLSYIVAMTVSSLEKVLAYVGSTGSTSISFILPGLFYYKISSPHSPHHQRLMKDEDDEEEYAEDDDDADGANEGASGREGGKQAWWDLRLKGRHWRRDLLRKLSLALAIYGLVVMVTCLVTNTFFVAVH